ncbi:MAG: prepilin peptidase [FCB group bacterium]|nr:prepilin peptidase [FCB group bacterium]
MNVVIVRIPQGKSIIFPSSHCPYCETPIRWWQNIPILSFILLRGRCSECRKSISWRYPLVEGLTGLLFGYSVLLFGISLNSAIAIVLIGFLIPIAFIDYDEFLIFDVLSYSGIVAGLLLSAVSMNFSILISAIIGGIVGAGSLLVIRGLGNILFRKESMGLGDIKLAGLIGVFLGWQLTLLSFFFGAVLIVLVYAIKAVIRFHPRPDERYPFGFYFSWAAIGMLFWGNKLMEIYLNFLHLSS